MPVVLDVFKEKRIVPIQFARACSGNPVLKRPDIDDRGFGAPERGPVVGMQEGTEAIIRLQRVQIDDSAPLFAMSTAPDVVAVKTPADGRLGNAIDVEIGLLCIKGGQGAPQKAVIQIRFGEAGGPIIASLTVWGFKPRTVNITPHVVTIQTAIAGSGVASTTGINNVIDLVKAVWRPCGIRFNVGATSNDTVTFATAGVVADSPGVGEINALLGTNPVANTINVYFVHQIGNGSFLGFGFARSKIAAIGLTHPGVVIADTGNLGGLAHDTMWIANDLAHEIGHFFHLEHPDNRQIPNHRNDIWCRRMLMHNYNLMEQLNNHRDDVGYGQSGGLGRRGCFISNKNLPGISHDAESLTARSAVVAGPY